MHKGMLLQSTLFFGLAVLLIASMLPASFSRYQQLFVANSTAPAPAASFKAALLHLNRPGQPKTLPAATAVRSMVHHHHKTPNVEAAAAAVTEAEGIHASDLQLPWWSKLRWRQTSKDEAAHAERSMLTKLVRLVQVAVAWAGKAAAASPAATMDIVAAVRIAHVCSNK